MELKKLILIFTISTILPFALVTMLQTEQQALGAKINTHKNIQRSETSSFKVKRSYDLIKELQEQITAPATDPYLAKLQQTLYNYKSCAIAFDCYIHDSNTEKQSYQENLTENIIETISKIEQYYRNKKTNPKIIESMMQSMLIVDEIQVQRRALDCLSLFPPSEKTVTILIELLQHDDNENLFAASMKEFQRHKETTTRTKIENFYILNFKQGSYYTSLLAASGLVDFFTEKSLHKYRKLVDSPKKNHPKYTVLRQKIDRFKKF